MLHEKKAHAPKVSQEEPENTDEDARMLPAVVGAAENGENPLLVDDESPIKRTGKVSGVSSGDGTPLGEFGVFAEEKEG